MLLLAHVPESCLEEVGHGGTLLIKMAKVPLNDFLYLNRLALSSFTEVGSQFSDQDSRLRPVVEKAKKFSTLQYPRSISVTLAILTSKV